MSSNQDSNPTFLGDSLSYCRLGRAMRIWKEESQEALGKPNAAHAAVVRATQLSTAKSARQNVLSLVMTAEDVCGIVGYCFCKV